MLKKNQKLTNNYEKLMRTYFIFFILVIMLFNGFAIEALQAQKLPDLIPYRKGDKWGFADSNRKVIIPPVYKWVRPFEGDVTVVADNIGDALIDKTGKIRIPSGYHNLYITPEEKVLAKKWSTFRFEKKVYRLYNIKGELKIRRSYVSHKYPNEGICLYRDRKNRAGYVDTNGKVIVKAKYVQGEDFKCGRAVVDRGTYYGCTMGYIDRTGKEFIPSTNAFCNSFINGFAKINRCNGTHEIVDTNGKVIYSAPEATIPNVPLGKLTPIHINGKYGYVDSSFKILIQAVFENAEIFHEGYAVVMDSAGNRGLINEKGELVIPFIYKWIKHINNGVTIVNNVFNDASIHGIRYGLVDTAGKIIIPIKYGMNIIMENMILAQNEDKIGYFNIKGELIIPFQYDDGSNFYEGRASVKKNKKWAVINKEGKLITIFKFDRIKNFNNGIAIVEVNGREFYIDKYGNEYYEEQ